MTFERTSDVQQKPARSVNKDVPWYEEDVGDVPEPVQQLLEQYSGIPADQVKEQILTVRERAWNTWPYPCIGLFRFLDLGLSRSPLYPEVLSRMQQLQTLLDLGCCFGQDVRKLIFDGAPAERIYGSDLRGEFIEIGYDLFRDGDRRRANFFAADVFDRDQPDLKRLEGTVDIIHAASFIHLFDYQGQIDVCKRLVQILRPVKDVLVVGRQTGHLHPGEYKHNAAVTGTMFRHDDKSFVEMWKRVGVETGTSWRVDIHLREISTASGRSTSGQPDDPNSRYLLFAVRRED
ncbi:MAG: hypothetical protein M1816_001818 [Peltula sp. TS41687]|nr:MAG: hypothetical protein M1816_001818 [Peltula sp. TS41687]